MPGNVRKDDKARRIAFNILGAPSTGLTDSFGKKKRMKRKKRLVSSRLVSKQEDSQIPEGAFNKSVGNV